MEQVEVSHGRHTNTVVPALEAQSTLRCGIASDSVKQGNLAFREEVIKNKKRTIRGPTGHSAGSNVMRRGQCGRLRFALIGTHLMSGVGVHLYNVNRSS